MVKQSRLTPDLIKYRAQLWLYLIANTVEGVNPLAAFCGPAQKPAVMPHILAFMADRVDLANGFELILSENEDALIRRDLKKQELTHVLSQLF